MKLLITGAGGFLGRHVVASAVRCGHMVRAMVRPTTQSIPASWADHPQVEIVHGDLRVMRSIDSLLSDVDTVVHLAATKAGDLYEQFSGTVIATENLLKAMHNKSVGNLVLTSSFSVYEYLRKQSWSMLDETSPMAADPFLRDEYCQTKLVQERMVLDFAEENDLRCVVLRAGVIFGRNNLWTARLGMQLNDKWWIRTGANSPLPLTYVENCSEAIVLSAEYNGSQRRIVLNVVDKDTPSQRDYLNTLCDQLSPRPRILPVPWTLMRILALLAWLTNKVFFKGTAKVPGLFVPSRLHARCKPLRYNNHKISLFLKWRPRYTWQEGIKRSLSSVDASELIDIDPINSITFSPQIEQNKS